MGSGTLNKLLLLFIINILTQTATSAVGSYADDVVRPVPQIKWLFADGEKFPQNSHRVKRGGLSLQNIPNATKNKLIDEPACKDQIRHLCPITAKLDDDLVVLECVQTFKANEVAGINERCQHAIWAHILELTSDQSIKDLTSNVCGTLLDRLGCKIMPESKSGTYLACVIDKREEIGDQSCLEYIERLEWVAFSDFRVVTHFDTDCQADIKKFECGRIQPYKEISQGQTLACLQQRIDDLEVQCKKRILHVSEIQADNIKLDRQLYMACTQDHIKFCPDIRPGSGQVYKCLMQHKTDTTMTPQCQDQLTRREKLIASDYRVSKGLVKACKEDIKTYHCRRSVSEDKDIRLAQILLCLESVIKNMSVVATDCQVEMFDHRKILMEDYRLSPEIVSSCSKDITNFCNRLEVGGKTIHCLMEHTRARKKKLRVAAECQRAVSILQS